MNKDSVPVRTVKTRRYRTERLRIILAQIDADLDARRRSEEEAAWRWYEEQRRKSA